MAHYHVAKKPRAAREEGGGCERAGSEYEAVCGLHMAAFGSTRLWKDLCIRTYIYRVHNDCMRPKRLRVFFEENGDF